MCSTPHTPGPLKIKGPSRPLPGTPEGGDYALIDSTGGIIAEAFRRLEPGVDGVRPAVENARRLAACWNACIGITTEQVETIPGLTEARLSYHLMRRQRDDVIAQLEHAAQWFDQLNRADAERYRRVIEASKSTTPQTFGGAAHA